MTILEEIGAWVAATPSLDAVASRLGIHCLDATGAWIAGRATAEAAELAGLQARIQGLSGGGASGRLDRLALRVATTRLTEIDDIHMASCTTAGSVVIPTALTLAAAPGMAPVRAADFAQALRAGYGVMAGFGEAISGPTILYRGILPTYLLAPLGAAATAARLLRLDGTACAHALAIALTSLSGGLGMPGGKAPRWLLIGQAARAGALAALAAAEGFQGDLGLIEGDFLARVHGVACPPDALAAQFTAAHILPGLSIKPFCAAKQTIAAIAAFRDLLGQGLVPERIAEIEVRVPPAYAAMIGHRHASASRLGRISSVAYQLALAACRPDALGDIIRPDLTADPAIAAIMARVRVAADEELAGFYPRSWPARVRVVQVDGAEFSALVTDAPGDPAHPFSAAEAGAKFAALATACLGGATGNLARDLLAAPVDDAALAIALRGVEAVESVAA